ncbi:PRC-barrel domain-containing protein [Candidatus Saccharibacteria bacterium]|nr:MAG: PRC-barrel domain-containing protein [Candidatus Saccharibacteria bacterium]
MLKLSESLIGQPVMSLRTGQPVARITTAIYNPNNLKIEGFYCQDKFSRKELVLLYQDVRDVIPQGVVINDHDVLVEAHELVRLKKIMDIGFELIGKQVVTLSKQRLGKVTDFSTEVETMYIQKIYVSRGILKGLTRGNLAIDRSQINEITDKKIIVNDLLDSAAVPAGAAA